MTQVEDAIPRDPTKKFVHCSGRCGHQLLIVPKDAQSFICPAENMMRLPRSEAKQKMGPSGHKKYRAMTANSPNRSAVTCVY